MAVNMNQAEINIYKNCYPISNPVYGNSNKGRYIFIVY